MRSIWKSLAIRCSSRILWAVLLLNVGVIALNYQGLSTTEVNEQRQQLENLLDVTQNSARAACFANNSVLAQEVTEGMQRSKLVNGASIWADTELLASAGQVIALANQDTENTITRPVYSPFDDSKVIGRIAISLDTEIIKQEAQEKVAIVAILLILQAILLAIVVIWVVFALILKPLNWICMELHELRPFEGQSVAKLFNHEHDELGFLIDDINRLSRRLALSYSAEKKFRVRTEQAEKKFRAIFEHAPTGLFVVDDGGGIKSFNRHFNASLEIDDECSNLFMTPLGEEPDKLWHMLRQSEVCSEQFELIDSAGHSKWLQLILHRIDDDLWQGILNDITELKRHELYQQSIANTDALTGIANRRLFDHHLDNLIRQPLSSASPFILMLIDLDWFKQVNDLYGHSAGDTVLQKMAEILQASVRTADFIGRLGGDEFAVILANCPQVETAAQIAQKIIASIKQPILVNEMDYVRVGASIGIAVCDRGCTSLSELFDHADSALYQAKADGRNCFRVYSDELTAQVSC